MQTPNDRRFAETHEWVRLDDDGLAYVGISNFAQQQLGDIVYVDLPEIGIQVVFSEEVAVVESVKAASDIYAPIEGEIAAINELLMDEPELVNQDPYDKGWFFAILPSDPDAVDGLLEASDYDAICDDEND